MEIETKSNHTFYFKGEGASFFGLLFINWVLTVISLGLYYPWAKERRLKFLYGETEFANSRFSFHGTGREMFKGFIKAILVFGILYGIYFAAILSKDVTTILIGFLVFFSGFIFLIPVAVHGTMRYRLSKTEYRGIRFSYTGNLRELMKIYFKGILFTILTFGIYGAWMQVNLRKYVAENTSWGDTSFDFKGTGGDLFVTNLLGLIFSIFTLYIYMPWFIRNIHRFYINNMVVNQAGSEYGVSTNISAGNCFKVFLFYLAGVFTLGIVLPWAMLYEIKVMLENVEVDGNLDLNRSLQTNNDSNDATGEDIADMLDLDLTM